MIMCHSRTISLLILLASFLLSGCPPPFAHGALATGVGWSADVVIHNGVIHTARRNYDAMTLEYAYRRLEEKTWNVETVDRFLAEGEKAYVLGGPEPGSVLRLAVDGDAVYLAYVGLEKGSKDGALDGLLGTSFKLAERKDGQWQTRELRRWSEERLPRPQILDVARSSGHTYVFCTWDCYQCVAGDELAVVGDQGVNIYPLDLAAEEIEPVGDSLLVSYLRYDPEKKSSYLEIRNMVPNRGQSTVEFSHPHPGTISTAPNGEIAAILSMGGRVMDQLGYALRSNGWSVTQVSLPEELVGTFLPQGSKYDTRPFLLVLRYADGDLGKGSVGIGTVKDGTFEVEWVDVPPRIYDRGVRFDVSLPYVVVTFPTLDNSQTEKRSGPYGTATYEIRRSTHHVYTWDGATWSRDTVP